MITVDKTGLECPKKIQHLVGKSKGQQAQGKTIPVDTPMHIAQRPLHANDICNWAIKNDGIDWNLFGYATAVEHTDGSFSLLDGQQRCQLIMWLAPEVDEIPAHVIPADSQQYEAWLFANMNGGSKKLLSPEELLWAEILAKDPVALNTKHWLDMCSLGCGQYKEDREFTTKRSIFEKAINYCPDSTVVAVDLLTSIFPEAKQIDGQVVCGMAKLGGVKEGGVCCYSDYFDNTTPVGALFEQWLKGASFHFTLKDLRFNEYKNAGGGGNWELGCAFGICQSFNKWLCKINKGHLRVPLKHIQRLYDKEV